MVLYQYILSIMTRTIVQLLQPIYIDSYYSLLLSMHDICLNIHMYTCIYVYLSLSHLVSLVQLIFGL